MVRKALLVCGILSSLLYAAMNIFIPMQWEDYSVAAQTVSELSAIGAPTRPVWVAWSIGYTVLILAFAWGVWQSAGTNRPLRIVGGLMLAHGVIDIFWPFAPMHFRGAEFALTDALHIALGIATVLLMFLLIGFGAAAFGKRFRLFSIVCLAVFLLFGTLTAIDSPRIAENLPTPWIGVWERINIGVFMLWLIVLTILLLKEGQTEKSSPGSTARMDEKKNGEGLSSPGF